MAHATAISAIGTLACAISFAPLALPLDAAASATSWISPGPSTVRNAATQTTRDHARLTRSTVGDLLVGRFNGRGVTLASFDIDTDRAVAEGAAAFFCRKIALAALTWFKKSTDWETEGATQETCFAVREGSAAPFAHPGGQPAPTTFTVSAEVARRALLRRLRELPDQDGVIDEVSASPIHPQVCEVNRVRVDVTRVDSRVDNWQDPFGYTGDEFEDERHSTPVRQLRP